MKIKDVNKMTMQNDDFLTEKKPNNTVYLQIFEGMLCQKRASEADGFLKYEGRSIKTKGKTYFVKPYDEIKGFLTGIHKENKETQDGSSKYVVLQFTLESLSGRKALLEVNAKANFVAEFAKRCESFDYFQPIQIGAFWGTKTNATVITFKQNGEKIDSSHTKENPNGLPAWEKDELGEWDAREYWKFLYAKINEHASQETLDRVKEMVFSKSQPEEYQDNMTIEGEIVASDEDDQIPF